MKKVEKISLIILSVLLVSCSGVNAKNSIIEKENKKMFERLEVKKIENEKILKEKGGYLSLEDAIEIGMLQNTDIKLKEIQEKVANLDKKISFGNFLPKISSFYTMSEMDRYLSMSVSDPTIRLNIFSGITLPQIPSTMTTRMVDRDFRNYAVTAQLPVFVPATWFLYSARSRGEDISVYTKDLTKKMTRLKIIQEYYYILALKAEKKVLENELKYAEKLKKNSDLALETGSILVWQNEQAKLLLKQKENAILNNKRDEKVAKIKLLKDLSLSLDLDFKTVNPEETQNYEIPSLEEAIYQALINSELIKINHNLVAIEKAKIKIAISNFLPKVILGGGLYGSGLSMISPQQIFMGAIGGILSIFNGFKDVHEYKKAKLHSEAAYLKREETIAKTILSVITTYNDLEKSSEDKDLAYMNYDVARGKYKQKKLENEVGEISNADFIKEISEYEKAVSMKEKARYKYNVTLETFKMMIGDKNNESK